MAAKQFIIDVDTCTGCKLCMFSCKDEHVDNDHAPWAAPQPATGHLWIDVKALERGAQPRLKLSYLPVFCQHCADAPCIPACPDNAILTRDDGIVWIDSASCTNCGECVPACPYDVIFMNAELAIAQKCNGCAHRVDEGELPRCAEVCPHDAIVFAEPDSPAAAAGAKPLEEFHPEYKAAPRIRWRGLPRPWIAGTVTDAAGEEVIAGATVTATDGTGATLRAETDAFGDFRLSELADGARYEVEIAAAGFAGFATTVTTDGDQDLGTVALSPGG